MSYNESLLATHCGTRKRCKRSQIRRVERSTCCQHTAFRYVRRVHAIEQKHCINALEVIRVAENLTNGSMTRGKTNQRQATNALRLAERCSNLACHSLHQRIERRWVGERTIKNAGAGTEIHYRNRSGVLQSGCSLFRQPRGTKKMNDQIHTLFLA